jgi:hypothetical protein
VDCGPSPWRRSPLLPTRHEISREADLRSLTATGLGETVPTGARNGVITSPRKTMGGTAPTQSDEARAALPRRWRQLPSGPAEAVLHPTGALLSLLLVSSFLSALRL